MSEIFNATTNNAMGNWQNLGVVIGIAAVRHDDLSLARDLNLEQHGQRVRAARESALERMNAQAAQKGASVVVGIRFDSVVSKSSHSYGQEQIIEYTAYGTALKLA